MWSEAVQLEIPWGESPAVPPQQHILNLKAAGRTAQEIAEQFNRERP